MSRSGVDAYRDCGSWKQFIGCLYQLDSVTPKAVVGDDRAA